MDRSVLLTAVRSETILSPSQHVCPSLLFVTSVSYHCEWFLLTYEECRQTFSNRNKLRIHQIHCRRHTVPFVTLVALLVIFNEFPTCRTNTRVCNSDQLFVNSCSTSLDSSFILNIISELSCRFRLFDANFDRPDLLMVMTIIINIRTFVFDMTRYYPRRSINSCSIIGVWNGCMISLRINFSRYGNFFHLSVTSWFIGFDNSRTGCILKPVFLYSLTRSPRVT